MRTLRVYGLASEPISFISGNSNTPLVYDAPRRHALNRRRSCGSASRSNHALFFIQRRLRGLGGGRGEKLGREFARAPPGSGGGFFLLPPAEEPLAEPPVGSP